MESLTDDRGVPTWRVKMASMLWLAAAATGVAQAQEAPFENVTTLSTDVIPIEREFQVPQAGAGQYRMTLTDYGALLTVPGPAPLESVKVLITRGKTVVATLDGNDEDDVDHEPVDIATFDATPGAYTIHIVGKPGTDPGSGPLGLLIESVASSTPVLTLNATLSAPDTAVPGLSTYQTEIDIPTAGNYELTLADLGFPEALETSGAFLFQPGASSLTACLSLPEVPAADCRATKTLNLAAGKYLVVAAGGMFEASDTGGVFSVHFRSTADGTVVHSRTVELGRVKRISPNSFQLDAGAHALRLKDLGFPKPLATVSALVTRAAQVTAVATTATPEVPFTVASNDTPFDVFTYASPDATEGAGSFQVEVKPDTAPALLRVINAVGSPTGSPVAFAFTTDLSTAGSYRASIGDLQFPAALNSARLAVVQDGAIKGSTSVSDLGPNLTLNLASLGVGSTTAIVVVKPALVGGTLQQSGGAFGLEVVSTGGAQSSTVLDVAQGIGPLVSVRKVSIPQAGKYDITLADLDFPDAFHDLMAVVSRGAQKLGTIFVGGGGGTNSQGGTATLPDFVATAGNYSLTVVAQPSETEHAATYGLSVLQSPAGPTITLGADTQAVTSGSTSKLTWSTQNATSCTASSTPAGIWSGTKAVSGTETTAAITTATTFKLTCVGAGGRSAEQTASVGIAATGNAGGGGGGAFGLLGVLGLAACRVLASARKAGLKV